MIIVSSFKEIRNCLTGNISIFSEEEQVCPLCGGELVYRDNRKRKVKNFLGNVIVYLLRNLRCESCNKYHTEIPDTIQPFKHYDSATIQSAIDGNGHMSACVADNSTISRWKASFTEAASDMSQRLVSVCAQATDEKIPVAAASRILGVIKARHERWLAFVMKLLINGGHKICTRFAFCPSVTPYTIRYVSKLEAKGGEKNDKTIKNSS